MTDGKSPKSLLIYVPRPGQYPKHKLRFLLDIMKDFFEVETTDNPDLANIWLMEHPEYVSDEKDILSNPKAMSMDMCLDEFGFQDFRDHEDLAKALYYHPKMREFITAVIFNPHFNFLRTCDLEFVKTINVSYYVQVIDYLFIHFLGTTFSGEDNMFSDGFSGYMDNLVDEEEFETIDEMIDHIHEHGSDEFYIKVVQSNGWEVKQVIPDRDLTTPAF